MSNVGRAVVKKLAVKFEGNEILSVDHFDVFACYRDLWKTDSEKRNALRQGIIHSGGCTLNCMKLKINYGDKDATNAQDDAITKSYRNKFIIPLEIEMLDSVMPCYQAGLGNRLCYEITFNDYGKVINTSGQVSIPDTTYKYKITSITLEYEIFTQPDILQVVSQQNTKTWIYSMTEFSDTSKFK